jgi:acetyl esterase
MPGIADRVPASVQAATVRALFGLPAPVRRLLAGRPVRQDGQRLESDTQLLLRLMKLEGLTLAGGEPARARAVMEQGAPLANGPMITGVQARDLRIPGDDGPIPARIYTPEGLADGSPMLVFYHGGGWVIGSVATHDNTCRFLAAGAGVRVLSVDYRLAPEHPFPAAVTDSVTAFRYAVAHAAEWGADPGAIAVGGDSAGGNLAAVVCHVTAEERTTRPAFALLFYPGVDASAHRPSKDLFGKGYYLTAADMDWFLDRYVPDTATRTDPRFSVLRSTHLADFPPTYLTVGGFDPLRDEVEEFGALLAAAGVPVVVRRHPGLIHGFANYLGIIAAAREATSEAVGALRTGLAINGTTRSNTSADAGSATA